MTRTVKGPILVLALGLVTAGCGMSAGQGADSADYPFRAITMVVPYSAGGATDLASRAVAECMEGELGQAVAVENRDGSSGAVAMEYLISQPADGYTIGTITAGTTVITPLANDLDYSAEDFRSIGLAAEVPHALVVPADSEYETAEQLIEDAQSNPEQVTIGTAGPTTPQGIEITRLAELYDVPVQQVPFEGDADLLPALLGGHVSAGFGTVGPPFGPALESGELRALAVGSPEQSDQLPDVPTFAELGMDELTLGVSSYAFAAPAGTPDEVVETLGSAVETCATDEEVVQKLESLGLTATYQSPEEFDQYLAEIAAPYEEILGS